MKASERWLREGLKHPDDGRDFADPGMLADVRRKWAEAVARIDAAAGRFDACSEPARLAAHNLLSRRDIHDWAAEPNWWEALADVAEGIDRRQRGSEPTDTERLDWIERYQVHRGGPSGHWFIGDDMLGTATLRAAIDEAMARAKGEGGE